MKVEIEGKSKNQSMHRTEIKFRVENAEKTPSRADLREKLSAMLDAKPENLIVDSVRHEFGTMQVFGTAKLYESPEFALRLELEKAKRKNFPETFKKEEKKKKEKGKKAK